MTTYLDYMNQVFQVLNQDDLEILRFKICRSLSYQLIGDQLLVIRARQKENMI